MSIRQIPINRRLTAKVVRGEIRVALNIFQVVHPCLQASDISRRAIDGHVVTLRGEKRATCGLEYADAMVRYL